MNTYSLCNDETCPNKDNCKRFDKNATTNQGYEMDLKYVCNTETNYKWQIKKDNIVDNIVENTKDNNSDSANNAQADAQKQE